MIERVIFPQSFRDRFPNQASLPRLETEDKILILAPTANDARLAANFLAEAGLLTEVCRDMHDLCHKAALGCGAILLAEEAIGSTSVAVLVSALDNQPSWSDIPVTIITSGGEASQARLRRLRIFGPGGNVTLIERPFRPGTLTSTMETALRFRQRQYMVRDLLEQSRESKEHLEFVMKAGGLGAWKLDLDTKTVSWSETCKANFGLNPDDEITFERLMSMIDPDDRDQMRQSMERAIKTGSEYQAEYRISTPSGEHRWIQFNGRVAFSDNGAPMHLSGVTQNVTERKRAEAALRESSERTSNILASISDGLIVLDPNWRFTYLNDKAARILGALGKDRKELMNEVFWHVFPEIRGTVAEKHYRQAFARQVTTEFEFFFQPLQRWFDIRVYPAKESIAIYFLDITERKHAEEALRDSEAKFRELADAMPQVVWSARADGEVDYYNKRWFELTGSTGEGKSGPSSWVPILHPEDHPACVKAWKHSVASHEPFEFECRFNDHKWGSYRWYMIRALPMKNESGNVVRWFGTCTDIHERKRWAEELEKMVAERTAALQQTIHSLETFNYSIAHDLRAPLRAMAGFSDALLQDYKVQLDATGQGYLERIRNAALRMDRLVSDILAYGRLAQQDLPLEPIDTREVLDKVLNDLASEMQELKAKVTVQPPLPPVMANGSVLNQVLLNLVSNAMKFVSDGTAPTVTIGAYNKGNRVRLWIEDNGIGIAPEHNAKIFDMFQQLHRAEYAGTGIGLALVKKGVERMNGTIGLKSSPGQGSCFWIELPAVVTLKTPKNTAP